LWGILGLQSSLGLDFSTCKEKLEGKYQFMFRINLMTFALSSLPNERYRLPSCQHSWLAGWMMMQNFACGAEDYSLGYCKKRPKAVGLMAVGLWP